MKVYQLHIPSNGWEDFQMETMLACFKV